MKPIPMRWEEFAFTLHPHTFDWSKADPENLEKWSKAREVRTVDFVTLKGAEKIFNDLEKDLNGFYESFSAARAERKISGPAISPEAESSGEDQE